jgi:hypothetical protein
MNSLPCLAKLVRVLRQRTLDVRGNVREFPSRKPVILPKLHRPCPAVQIEYSFTAPSNHMYVSRPVVVWINHDAQSIKSENCRHRSKFYHNS